MRVTPEKIKKLQNATVAEGEKHKSHVFYSSGCYMDDFEEEWSERKRISTKRKEFLYCIKSNKKIRSLKEVVAHQTGWVERCSSASSSKKCSQMDHHESITNFLAFNLFTAFSLSLSLSLIPSDAFTGTMTTAGATSLRIRFFGGKENKKIGEKSYSTHYNKFFLLSFLHFASFIHSFPLISSIPFLLFLFSLVI